MTKYRSALGRLLSIVFIMSTMVVTAGVAPPEPQGRIKTMLLTGQSNQYHNWAVSSVALKRMLDDAGKFDVTVVTSPAKGQDMSGFAPAFAGYGAIVMDYEGDDWPEPTRRAFADYIRNGGGLVLVHAADNAFPKWQEFLEMSGVGGWGGRDETWGPKVRWRDGKVVLDSTPGTAMHPARHDFLVVSRAPAHPIMKGLPAEWLHANDEIYSQLRGPAKNLEVLATASADPAKMKNSTGEHEPMFMTIQYGKGRVFHNTLGHVGPKDTEPVPALTSVGYIVSIQRGTEWVATGNVTQPVPADFPTAARTSLRGR
jgi:type 1 glutamine amidotransferase